MISDFPLFLFTVLAGLASGGYIASAFLPDKGSKANPWLFPAVSLVLLAVGGVAAFMHLGRPELAYQMAGNLGSPLMLEGITAACLAVVSIVDLVMCRKGAKNVHVVRIIGAVFGAACLVAMTYAYAISFGNDAWSATPTCLLFVVGGLAGGVALWAALAQLANLRAFRANAVVDAAFACVLVWQAIVFADIGADGVACIAAGAVLAAAGTLVALAQPKIKAKASAVMPVVAVLSIAALVVSRYGFYMASII